MTDGPYTSRGLFRKKKKSKAPVQCGNFMETEEADSGKLDLHSRVA